MIIVADSGSTKCDWLIAGESGTIEAKSMGFNPFFHSTDLVLSKLKENAVLTEHQDAITAVYFYGAGCSSPERNLIIEKALSQFFHRATTVSVGHDLEAAALATTPGKAGIACIIGTGSNSCFYDGNEVHEAVPALGYILGDEGSGSYFGKIMLRKFLYNQLPTHLQEAFGEEYGLTKELIFDGVYNLPNPNVYLASFMKFLSARKTDPFLRDLIYEGLAVFAHSHVWCYDQFRDVPVHFVGSIAYYFSDILEEVAKNHRFTIGNVIKKPVMPLLDYHLERKTIDA
jgi:hypothetical protein